MSATYREYMGDGLYVTVQYCEAADCDEYLGVNYPSDFCFHHRPDLPARSANPRPACDGTLTLVDPPWLRCDGPRPHTIRRWTPEELAILNATHEPPARSAHPPAP